MTRLSAYLLPTLKDAPADAEANSHKLMVRAGLVRQLGTGIWTWQTLDAARIGVLNDLYVVPDARGAGVGRSLIEHCRGLCRQRAAAKLVWETAPDNETAQRLYDGIGAERSTWLTYEIDAW